MTCNAALPGTATRLAHANTSPLPRQYYPTWDHKRRDLSTQAL